jgi:hypothetical protein
VSNSDNLGATLDLDLLAHFAHSDAGFMMEVRCGTAGQYCCGVVSIWAVPFGLLARGREGAAWGSSQVGRFEPAAQLPGRVTRPRPLSTTLCSGQVCERQSSDKKGGHLARRKKDGRLM